MFHAVKALFVFFFLSGGLVAGRFGCRLCSGHQIINFDSDVNEAQATTFFVNSLGKCATGNDYEILKIESKGRVWTFHINVWRYCGNGASNFVERGKHTIGTLTALSDGRALKCTKSVTCSGKCDCPLCGC